MSVRVVVGVLTAAVSMSCRAETNDLERAVASFPKINAWDYRPDLASQSANVLIRAGEDAACTALETAVRTRREQRQAYVGFNDELFAQEDVINRNACHLCRLLFTPTNSSEPLRPPRIGALSGMPYESMNPSGWPDLPFVIIGGIPLAMNLGYAGSGIPERAENYLAYCKANGSFRTKSFTTPTPVTASNALSAVFSSPVWKALKWKDEGLGWSYSLDEDDTKMRLWKQVDNMANPTVQRTGASRLAQETNRTSSPAGSRR